MTIDRNFDRGSEWRKWDLHVHSPYSVLSSEYPGDSFEKKWNCYLDALEKINDVSVLGITDYFSVEGYKRAIIEQSSGRLKNFSLLLPNVELRLDINTRDGKPINLHVIFSPNVVSDLETTFFARLDFRFRENSYAATRPSLILLGRAYLNDDKISEEEALRNGMEQFKVSKDQLINLFNKDKNLRNNSFIVIADKSTDGVSGLRDDSLRATREELYRFANAIFSSNPKNCKYFLGEGADNETLVTTKFGSLKPCVHGSDAHSPETICKPDLDRFTWIKANPTFEGLRQIIFEPKERVYIGVESPQKRDARPFFSNIRIDSGKVFENGLLEFQPCDIPLNPNLICVIGGRGSGKSVLLSSLKRTFNKEMSNNPDDNSQDIRTQNFHVTFKKLDDSKAEYHIQNENNLEYLHVSQGEVKHIVKNPTLLDEQIKTMLGISDPGSSLFSNPDMKGFLARISEIKDFFLEVDASGKRIYSEEYQKNEIAKNRQLISTITTDKNKELIEVYCENVSTLSKVSLVETKVFELMDDIQKFSTNQNEEIEELNNELPDQRQVSLIEHSIQLSQLSDAKQFFESRRQILITENQNISDKFEAAGIQGDITTLLEKVNSYQAQIEKHEDNIRSIVKMKSELEDLFDKLKSHSKEVENRTSNYVEQISNSWSLLRKGKKGWSAQQKALSSKLTESIEVNGVVKFDLNNFYNTISPSINRSKFRATKDVSFDEKIRDFLGVSNLNDYYRLIENERIIDIGTKRISLSELLDENYFVNGGEEEIVKSLFKANEVSKYLKVICELKYADKTPAQLSVGQRGTLFVCLKLATDTFGQPFVFDQPEDDLDNKFIMTELVPLFRTIKKFRQVIVITHNANLVVNADAEQIIFAINEGEKIVYHCGAIENSQQANSSDYGIREIVCDVLEGGSTAFKKREQKYRLDSD